MKSSDDELRHYAFARSSGLPLDYFQRHRRIDWPAVGNVLVVLAAVAVLVAAVAGVLS